MYCIRVKFRLNLKSKTEFRKFVPVIDISLLVIDDVFHAGAFAGERGIIIFLQTPRPL